MASEHIVKSFDDQLKRLENLIAEMGGLAEMQLADAIEAMSQRDLERAAKVTESPTAAGASSSTPPTSRRHSSRRRVLRTRGRPS